MLVSSLRCTESTGNPMGRHRPKTGLVEKASRLRIDPPVADHYRAEAFRRGITVSELMLEKFPLAETVPKTVVDPSRRRPHEPLIVQVPTLLSRINDQLRPPIEPDPVEAPPPPLTPTMPSPAPEPPPEPFLAVWEAAVRQRGHESPARSSGHVAALREVYVTAAALAPGRGLKTLELFRQWIDTYLDGGDATPSPIAMAMQMHRLVLG